MSKNIANKIIGLIKRPIYIKLTENRKHIILKFPGFKIKLNIIKCLSFFARTINERKIVFSNYLGNSYGCNPKYITEELLRKNSSYELVWLVKNSKIEKVNFPQQVRVVEYFSLRAIWELLTAKLWIDNTRKIHFWSIGGFKKSNQFYIQTWHGSLGIKKMEGDSSNEDPFWRHFAKIDSNNIDCIISNSKFLDSLYNPTTFWYSGEIKRIGHPRNDIFFVSEQQKNILKQEICKKLNIMNDSLIILYAPTFRDDGDLECFDLDFQKIQQIFSTKYKKKCAILLRLHPAIPTEVMQNVDSKNVINVSQYPDIQELLLSTDILISDYSSCMFDFMLTKRPVFIYAKDIEKYNFSRGFYYPLEQTPFPIAKNIDELFKNVNEFDSTKYILEIDKFLQEKECIDDGNASKRCVEIINQYM